MIEQDGTFDVPLRCLQNQTGLVDVNHIVFVPILSGDVVKPANKMIEVLLAAIISVRRRRGRRPASASSDFIV